MFRKVIKLDAFKKIGIVSQNPKECAEITSRPHPEHFVPLFFQIEGYNRNPLKNLLKIF